VKIGGTRTDLAGLRTQGQGNKRKASWSGCKGGKELQMGRCCSSKMQINSTIMGCFKNDAAYSQLKKEKKKKRCEVMYDGVVCC
jgi:hypothetical protein